MADILERGIKLGVDASPTKRGFAQIETAVNSLIKSMNTLDKSLSKYSSSASSATSATSALTKSQKQSISTTKKQTSAFNSAHKSIIQLRSVATSLGVIFSLRSVVNTIDNYTLLNARLKLVTNSTEELAIAQKDVVSIANNTRASLVDTVQLYTRISRALKGTQTSMADVATITSTVSKALVISGANAGEARASMLQLSQAFNKGKLDGDEFRTVMELMPPVAQAIAEEMNVTRGELLELAPQGKITAEIMSRALVNASEEISESFRDVPITIGQAVTVIGNKFTMLGGQLLSGPGKTIVSIFMSIADNMDALLQAGIATAAFFGTKFVASMAATIISSANANSSVSRLIVTMTTLNAVQARAAARGIAVSKSFLLMRGAAKSASVAFRGLYASLGPIGLLATAVSTAYILMSDSSDEATESQKSLTKANQDYEDVIKRLPSMTAEQARQERDNAKAKRESALQTLFQAQAEVALARARLDAAMADVEDDPSATVGAAAAYARSVEALKAVSDQIKTIESTIAATNNQISASNKIVAQEASDKYTKLIAKLDQAQQLLGKTEVAQAVLNNVRKAGLSVLDLEIDKLGQVINSDNQQIQTIAAKTRKYYEQKTALEALQDAEKAQKEFVKSESDKTKQLVQQSRYNQILVTQGYEKAELSRLEYENAKLKQPLDENAIQLIAQQSVEAKKMADQMDSQVDLANKIDSGFESALDGIIRGTTSAGDAFKALAVDIAAAIVKAQILNAISGVSGGTLGGGITSLFSGLFFASGGRPPTDQASVVGEKGPELFVPDTAGTIVSNSDLATGGGGTYVSVSNPVSVQIINQGTPQETQSQEQSTGPDGRTIIKLLVNDAVQQGINNGSFDATMATNYGVRRRGS